MRRRLCLFIPGFDPQPARRYREIMRREGPKQAEISGYDLTLSGSDIPNAWILNWSDGAEGCETTVQVLGWSDLVHGSLEPSGLSLARGALKTAWLYVHSGALSAMFRLRRGPVWVSLYPYAVYLAWWSVVSLAVAAAWAMLVWYLALTVTAVLLILQGSAFRQLDQVAYARYLLSDYVFWARDEGAYPAPLATRLASFSDTVAASLTRDTWDEVMVVGHSSGACVAISVLAKARRSLGEGRPVSLLTLGQVVPMLSLLPKATQLRSDLHQLAMDQRLTWVDVTAPGDPCCFALCDPVAVSGAGPAGSMTMISAAFRKSLSPDRRRAMSWRFFRRHLQYLHAFDIPAHFDPYLTLAGPKHLSALAARPSSPARITGSVLPSAVEQ